MWNYKAWVHYVAQTSNLIPTNFIPAKLNSTLRRRLNWIEFVWGIKFDKHALSVVATRIQPPKWIQFVWIKFDDCARYNPGLNIVCFLGIRAPVLCVLSGLRWVRFWIGGGAVGSLWRLVWLLSFPDATLWLRRRSCLWFCTLAWLVAIWIVHWVVYIVN